MMNIIDSLKWRYATKKFDNKKILSQEKVDILIEAFNLTATSYGLQPLKLIVIKNKELQKELTQHSWDQKQVADASHLLVFCIEKNIGAKSINKKKWRRQGGGGGGWRGWGRGGEGGKKKKNKKKRGEGRKKKKKERYKEKKK